jgi:hypothetical protein
MSVDNLFNYGKFFLEALTLKLLFFDQHALFFDHHQIKNDTGVQPSAVSIPTPAVIDPI